MCGGAGADNCKLRMHGSARLGRESAWPGVRAGVPQKEGCGGGEQRETQRRTEGYG